MKRTLRRLVFSGAFALLLLEIALALGTRSGRFPFEVPSYSLEEARRQPFLSDSNPDFGVWHASSSSSRHVRSCFDVTYRSNSYGARDVERQLHSRQPRVLVLGDSMIEGFGLSDEHRLSNLLERETGIEHLNFGVAGGFGTTQSYLLYKTLASRFSHAAVILGVLPDNDFWDNDFEYGRRVYPDRYRPYLVGRYPTYRLLYYQSSLDQGAAHREGWRGRAEGILREFSYSYHALDYLRRRVATRLLPEPQPAAAKPLESPAPYSGYYDYRKDQLDLMKYTFERIRQVAAGRQVIIALLPTRADFERYDATTGSPLGAELERFAAAGGMGFVDLLPGMYGQNGRSGPGGRSEGWDRYFHACDGHWGAEGHAVAARLLRDELTPLYRGLAP